MQRPNDSQALLIQIDRFFVMEDPDLANRPRVAKA